MNNPVNQTAKFKYQLFRRQTMLKASRLTIFAALIVILSFITGCGGGSDEIKEVKILHMNDSHSNIEGSGLDLAFDGKNTAVEVGGMAKAAALIDHLRDENTLVLHAGDAVQGTLYYSLFNGQADAEILNTMGFDAMVIGNHEFDDGDDSLSDFIDKLNFPVISANVVPDSSNILDGKFEPYIIKKVNGVKIGIIGITIAGKTKDSSNPSSEISFEDEAETVQKYVDKLKAAGVNKIIVLSHYGYNNSKTLATKVTDIDVIVDGDSHTLLGDFSYAGLDSSGEYPTMATNADGDKVCIVQAWEYGKEVGELDVVFRNGAIDSCLGTPHLVISDVFEQDDAVVSSDVQAAIEDIIDAHDNIDIITDAEAKETTANVVAKYSDQVDTLSAEVIGQAGENLSHNRVPGKSYNGVTLPLGSDIAPIVSKAFYDLSKKADICIQNAGGVRISINTGDITYGTAYTLLPFANTLYEIEMYGSEIKQVLEDAVEGIAQGGSTGGFPYAYALRYDVDASQAFGSRFSNLEVKDRTTGTWSDLDENKLYTVVTNSYTAAGKDGYTTFGTVQAERGLGVDTYLDYALSFVEYVKALEATNEDVMKLPSEDHPIKSYIAADPTGNL